MTNKPDLFVSLIVATYNQADFLPQCLESLLTQTINRSDYEIIVVNDGCSDNSKEILSRYESRIDKIVVHPERKGLVEACNSGLEHAQGRYIMRVDSDDWLSTEALTMLSVSVESEPLPDIVMPQYWIVDEEHIEIMKPDIENVFTWMAGGSLLRRNAVTQVGGYRDLYWEEYDLYLRMLCENALVKEFESPVLYHREHSSSMTAREEDRAKGWDDLARAWPRSITSRFGFHEELKEY